MQSTTSVNSASTRRLASRLSVPRRALHPGRCGAPLDKFPNMCLVMKSMIFDGYAISTRMAIRFKRITEKSTNSNRPSPSISKQSGMLSSRHATVINEHIASCQVWMCTGHHRICVPHATQRTAQIQTRTKTCEGTLAIRGPKAQPKVEHPQMELPSCLSLSPDWKRTQHRETTGS